jgi:hypothetical protein
MLQRKCRASINPGVFVANKCTAFIHVKKHRGEKLHSNLEGAHAML